MAQEPPLGRPIPGQEPEMKDPEEAKDPDETASQVLRRILRPGLDANMRKIELLQLPKDLVVEVIQLFARQGGHGVHLIRDPANVTKDGVSPLVRDVAKKLRAKIDDDRFLTRIITPEVFEDLERRVPDLVAPWKDQLLLDGEHRVPTVRLGDKYEIRGYIAKGGFGVVYKLAPKGSTGVPHQAVKLFHKSYWGLPADEWGRTGMVEEALWQGRRPKDIKYQYDQLCKEIKIMAAIHGKAHEAGERKRAFKLRWTRGGRAILNNGWIEDLFETPHMLAMVQPRYIGNMSKFLTKEKEKVAEWATLRSHYLNYATRLRQLFGDVFAGLHVLHKLDIDGVGGAKHELLGYAHLDIKGDNVMIDRYGHGRIIDYGLAAKPPIRYETGTPEYMAPELWPDSKDVGGFQSDLWSVGVMLYKQLTGTYPFEQRGWSKFLDEPPTCKGLSLTTPEFRQDVRTWQVGFVKHHVGFILGLKHIDLFGAAIEGLLAFNPQDRKSAKYWRDHATFAVTKTLDSEVIPYPEERAAQKAKLQKQQAGYEDDGRGRRQGGGMEEADNGHGWGGYHPRLPSRWHVPRDHPVAVEHERLVRENASLRRRVQAVRKQALCILDALR